ncbi:hypothetical protein GCM10009841_26260 [Microlunatus panaciterrae]|nr:DUF4082 domain-containing protein [Microlunatus panaciterrae]
MQPQTRTSARPRGRFKWLPAVLQWRSAAALLLGLSALLLSVSSATTASAETARIVTAPPTGTTSLLATTGPTSTTRDPDRDSVELGLRFSATANETLTGLRFFRAGGDVQAHQATLWSSTGRVLTTLTFAARSTAGWQYASFASPVAISANETYVASYHVSDGYAAETGFFTGDPLSAGGLVTSAAASPGVYAYGDTAKFPTNTYKASNYWIDPVVSTTSAAPEPTATEPPPADTAGSTTSGTFPNADNTGVPAGTTLSSYTGPTTITTAGTVIDSKKITGCLNIKADNVTIKNSLIQSGGCFFNVLSDNGNTGLKLTDVEIDGQGNTSGDSAINGSNFSCLRCDLHGTVDGAKAGSNVVIQDSYIHDLSMTSGSHNDGIQSLGTTSLRIVHNTIIIKAGSTSAIILSTGSASNMRNVLIDSNLLGGGAYTVYGGYLAGTDDLSKVSNISITNNQFTTQIFPKSGAYGPLTSTDSPVVVSGNTWYDGPNAGKSVY